MGTLNLLGHTLYLNVGSEDLYVSFPNVDSLEDLIVIEAANTIQDRLIALRH